MADDPTTDPQDDPQEPTAPAVPGPPPDPAPQAQPVPDPPKPAPPKDTWRPPTKAEWEDAQAKLKASNAENAERRKKLAKYEQERESEQEKAIREAVEAERTANAPRIIRTEAKSALLSAKARAERVPALIKLLDNDKLGVDDDGDVTGLDDQVKQLAKEYPEFFVQDKEPEPAPEKKTVPKVPGKTTPADEPRTLGEKIVALHNQ
jgi:protein TonB